MMPTSLSAGDLLLSNDYITIPTPLAVALGLKEAIIVKAIDDWCKSNQKTEKNYFFHEGFWWTKGRYHDWLKQMPYLGTVRTIQNHVLELETIGILVSANFNPQPTDRSKWYRVDKDRLVEYCENTLEALSDANTKNLRDGHEKVSSSKTKSLRDDLYKRPKTNIKENDRKGSDVCSPSLRSGEGDAAASLNATQHLPDKCEIEEEIPSYGVLFTSLRKLVKPHPLNKNLRSHVEKCDRANVLEAINRLEEDMEDRSIENPIGYFRAILDSLEGKSKPPKASEKGTEEPKEENTTKDTKKKKETPERVGKPTLEKTHKRLNRNVPYADVVKVLEYVQQNQCWVYQMMAECGGYCGKLVSFDALSYRGTIEYKGIVHGKQSSDRLDIKDLYVSLEAFEAATKTDEVSAA